MDQRLLDLFLELVRIDATSTHERPVLEYITRFLEDLGLEPREDASADIHGGDCGNLLCPVAGGGDRMLVAHMDTIQPTEGIDPQVKQDRITSDGTTILGADNRAGIASLLYGVEKMVKQGDDSPGFTLAFTVREELDSHGAGNLEIPEGIRYGVVFDSSLRTGKYIRQGYGAKQWDVTVTGRAAHAGLAPETGVNAIAAAGAALGSLPWGRLEDITTANVGSIEGGGKRNVVPERAVCSGEVRSLEVQRVEKVLDTIRGAFERETEKAGATFQMNADWAFKPYRHQEGDGVVELVESSIRAAGLTPEAASTAGGSDANELNARGIPSINIGIGAQQPHGTNEFIMLEDLDADGRIAYAMMTTRED